MMMTMNCALFLAVLGLITAQAEASQNCSDYSSVNLDYSNRDLWSLKFDESFTPAADVLDGSGEIVLVEDDEKLTIKLSDESTFCADVLYLLSDCDKLRIGCIAKTIRDDEQPVVVTTERAVYLSGEEEVTVGIEELCKRVTVTVDDGDECSISELHLSAGTESGNVVKREEEEEEEEEEEY